VGEELDKYSKIVDVVKYFIDSKRYGVVDRMALAMNSESVEVALYDMLRLIDSLMSRSVVVRLKSGEKEYTLRCCEIGDKLGYGVHGAITKVIEGETGYKEGDKVYCMPCPRNWPTKDEINRFLQAIAEDPFLARKIVLLAFGRRGEKEKEGE